MPKQKIPSQQRISKSTGRMMLAIAVFFDLFPLLLVLTVIIVVMVSFGGLVSSVGDVAKACADAGGWWDVIGHGKCLWGKGKLVVAATSALASGGLTGFFAGPVIYVVGSFIASTFAYIVFTVWFFVKGVNIWSFSSGERVLVNLGTIIVENIPLMDLLPGITFMAWRHIKVSQSEDKIKDSELLGKVAKVTSKLAHT